MDLCKIESFEIYISTPIIIDIDITIEKESRSILTGTLIKHNGTIAQNIPVTLFSESTNSLEYISCQLTDDDGNFSFVINDTNKKYTLKSSYYENIWLNVFVI